MLFRKVQIVLDKEPEQLQKLLKDHVLDLSSGPLSFKAKWEGLDNPEKFKLRPIGFGMFIPWIGRCSLSRANQNQSRFAFRIEPPLVAVVGFALVFVIFLTSIASFGYANFDTPGFWPSLILPTIAMALLFAFWRHSLHKKFGEIEKEVIKVLKSF